MKKILLLIILLLGCEKDEQMIQFSGMTANVEVALQEYYNPDSDTNKVLDGRTPVDTTIELVSDGTSFNQIRDRVALITDANISTKPYKINLTGTFKELDLLAKEGVWLNSNNGAIVETNGNWEFENDGITPLLSPADYTFGAYASTQFNLIPQSFTHGLWNHSNSITTGITFDSTKVKYNIHQDTSEGGQYHSIVEGCHFIKRTGGSSGFGFHIGMGARAGQIMSLRNNTREMHGFFSGIPRMFFWHNSASQASIAVLELISNNAGDIDFLIVTEQVSNQIDQVIITNNVDSKGGTGLITYQKATGESSLVTFDITNSDMVYEETTFP